MMSTQPDYPNCQADEHLGDDMHSTNASPPFSLITEIEVAIAVIVFKDKYLLARRQAHQHQGDKFEFVGGKIESGEQAKSALLREVKEELGLELQIEQLTKLGRIEHFYADQPDTLPSEQSTEKGSKEVSKISQPAGKRVHLHVYRVSLSLPQFGDFSTRDYGLEGQPIIWVNQLDLLAGCYPLPDANLPILTWLKLPETVCITQALSHFMQLDEQERVRQDWVDYHAAHLPQEAWVYLRPQLSRLTEPEQMGLSVASNISAAILSESTIGDNDSYNDLKSNLDGKQKRALNCQQQALLELASTLKASTALLQQRADIKGIVSIALDTLLDTFLNELLDNFLTNLFKAEPKYSAQSIMMNHDKERMPERLVKACFDECIKPYLDTYNDLLNPLIALGQIAAQHLTHQSLLALVAGLQLNESSDTNQNDDNQNYINQNDDPLDNDLRDYKTLLAFHVCKQIASAIKLPIIVSCHDEKSVRAANLLARWRINNHQVPIMAAFISPVLPTLTHPNQQALGWSRFAELSQLAEVPVIALGGLSPTDIAEALKHEAVAVAGIRQFLH
ncbi:MAG: NUDIX domain-containing protein [Psychrobacter sp.]|nr:NUDIX domain-containing protein [Psychrobacter sp.]